MRGASKPLEITLQTVRAYEPDGSHGDVHLVLNVRYARKRKVTLCKMSTDGMRKQGTPFSGYVDVLCSECTERIEQ